MSAPFARTGTPAANGARRRLAAPLPRRRGMAVVFVLALISMTLALSYSILRSQTSHSMIQFNSNLRLQARHAAMTGLSAGLREMHQSSWAGVGTSIAGTTGSQQGYTVTYTAGDASLTSGDPDYADLPYRVTVTSTGFQLNPVQPTVKSTHTIRAVVRLAPHAVATEPSDWVTALSNTIYQTEAQDFKVEVPSRIEGPVRIQGELKLSEYYYWSSSARWGYLSHLELMRQAGYGDLRPFDGPIRLDTTKTSSSTVTVLRSALGLSVTDSSAATSRIWSSPWWPSTYRLYPGGTEYPVVLLPRTLADVTLEPDPATNPLGMFVRSGDLTLYSNVNVRGMLLVEGDLELAGTGIVLEANDLAPLHGSDDSVQVPVAVVGNDLEVDGGIDARIRGLVALADELDIHLGSASTHFEMRGRMVTRRADIEGRTSWHQSGSTWDTYWYWFKAGAASPPSSPSDYFPIWLSYYFGLNPQPNLTFAPDVSTVTYHWKKRDDPVYAPGPSDVGMHWDLVEWTDAP